MACDSYVDFRMINPEFGRELERIGIKFNDTFTKCELSSGEKYKYLLEDGFSVPYLGLGKNYVLAMYFEYFFGCGNADFVYKFMKIMTENGFFESDYDFTTEGFDEYEMQDQRFYKKFTFSPKLLAYEQTVKEARAESYQIDDDGDICAFRVTVEKDTMNICEFDLSLYDLGGDGDIEADESEFMASGNISPDEGFDFWWDGFDEESRNQMTVTKKLVNGEWVLSKN